MKRRVAFLFALFLLVAPTAAAQSLPAASGEPAKVIRCENGYRYAQAGWIVLHIEGAPYERGVQHGRLLAPEIVGYLRCFALTLDHKAPNENWRTVRVYINALFLRKFDKEYLEEMQGIADGANSAGARFDDRPIDIVDILAINCWCEIQALDEANAATPTGLEGLKRKAPLPAKPMPHFERCSAFVATGPATADGKIVFGHVTMYELYAANFANVWIDVKPAQGRRFVMCSFPGGIQSGMDYYLNDAGILLSETSLTQTGFNLNGMTCASRVRKAIQYGDTIDKTVEHLVRDNNGLYTNEWLLADVNTNEIAMLELGTYRYKLWRSSKNEWFGDTPGFYWSCNSFKDMDLRLETIASAKAKPSKVVFQPSERDRAWVKLYEKHRGKIGVEFVKEFAASAVLTEPSGLDIKFTTTALAKELKSYASFGPPTGKRRDPTAEEKKKYPAIKPLVKHEWTLLTPLAPTPQKTDVVAIAAKILPDDADAELAWRGTLLPQTDADIWLATAFADYHEIVVLERMSQKKVEAVAKMQKALQECRTQYANASKTREVALADVKRSVTSDDWYLLASAKGVLLLHQLRRDLGAELFDRAMDDFGMKHGGQRVTAQQFQRHMEARSGRSLDMFFVYWLRAKGLPK